MRQEQPLAAAIGFNHQIPLAWRYGLRRAVIAALSTLDDIHRLIGPAVRRAFEVTRKCQTGERRPVGILRVKRKRRLTVGLTFDVDVDFPTPRILLMSRLDFSL